MKVVRTIEYEGPEADVQAHLKKTLLSLRPVCLPGDLARHGSWAYADSYGTWGSTPQVSIRLLAECVGKEVSGANQ